MRGAHQVVLGRSPSIRERSGSGLRPPQAPARAQIVKQRTPAGSRGVPPQGAARRGAEHERPGPESRAPAALREDWTFAFGRWTLLFRQPPVDAVCRSASPRLGWPRRRHSRFSAIAARYRGVPTKEPATPSIGIVTRFLRQATPGPRAPPTQKALQGNLTGAMAPGMVLPMTERRLPVGEGKCRHVEEEYDGGGQSSGGQAFRSLRR